MTRFRVMPDQSKLSIAARSSLHPIQGEATGLAGEAAVEVRDGRFDFSVPPKARLEVPVDRLRSGNALEDSELQRRIDARKFPTITAELRDVKPTPQPDRYRVTADLTFHGVTRRLQVEATAVNPDGTIVMDSAFEIDATWFDVKLPSFLGLKVYPEVKVRAHLVLKAVD